MRTPIYVLMAAFLLGGCTHYHAAPASSTSRPADRIEAPEPDPVEPLELDVGRPSGSQLLLQTNRPAYVAIFEIIPNRGVTLIYPAAEHQQNMLVSGLTWVPLWWSPKRVTLNSERYIYAVASEEPLQLSGETFTTGFFHRVLGPGIYRAERPYSTMRAISNAVVPNVADEAWAEDVYVLQPTYLTETYRTARIHCPGGRVFDVPEDMVARVWCPTRTRVVIVDVSRPRTRDYPVGRPARPDSVFGHGGGRLRIHTRPPRGPFGRVVDPTGRDRDDRDVRRGRDDRDDHDRRRRGDDERRDGRDDKNRDDSNDRDEEKPDKKDGGRFRDLIKDAKKQEQEREKQEKERQRREAEEARRREAEEREEARRREAEEREEDRRREREARKDDRDERKDERKDERDARKDERDERKDERKEETRQQGQAREEKRDDEREQKREEKRDDNKRRGSIRDLIKDAKEKDKKEKP